MLAFTSAIQSQLLLPAGDDNTSSVNIIVHIRDILNCVTQYDIYSLIVVPDTVGINTFVNVLQQTNVEIINTNPAIQLLAGGNPNIVGQILTSLSQVFNEMNIQSIETAVSSKYNCDLLKKSC